jgi:AAA domain-containing protein
LVQVTEPLSDADISDLGFDASSDGWAPHQEPKPSRLAIRDLDQVLEQVEQAGPAEWLIEPLWPSDAYGFLGAEDKAGKTWAVLDLAVSVRTGTPWLGRFECPQPGEILMFLGEGGDRPHLRRLDAVARSKNLHLADLMPGFRMAFAVPRLKSKAEVDEVRDELERHPSRLVVVDPFYLAAAGARGSDLFEMGEVLAGIQHVCQEAGSALVVTHHWNKTGEGNSAKRFTGVGPGAWGRVLGSAAVETTKTDPETRASTVLLRWEFIGGEIPQTVFRARRTVSSDDPTSLEAPLQYSVEVTDEGDAVAEVGGQLLSLSKQRALAALDGTTRDRPRTAQDITTICDADGRGPSYGLRTWQKVLTELANIELVDGEDDGPGTSRRWWLT